MTGISRRTVLSTLALGGLAGLGYAAFNSFGATAPVETLEPAPVTFGGWELVALDVRNAAVLVVDPVEQELLARLDVGGTPTGILQAGSSKMVIAVDAAQRRITVFRKRTALERATIDLEIEPALVALSPVGELFAVLDRTAGQLALVSADDGRVLALETGLAGAENLLFDTFGETLHLARANSPEILRFNPENLDRLEPIVVPETTGVTQLVPVRGEDWAIAVPPPDGPQALHSINLNTGEVERTIALPSPISRLIVDRRGHRLFAASQSRPEIYRLSIYGGLQATLETEGLPGDLVLEDIGRWFAVVTADDAAVSVYDAADHSLQQRHALPGPPSTMRLHLWSQRTVVASEEDGSLWMMDKDSNVRRMGLKGMAPALIATDGIGLCHA